MKGGTYNCPEIYQTSASARGYGSGTMYIKAPGAGSYTYEGYSYYARVETHTVGDEGAWAVRVYDGWMSDSGTYAYCNS